MLEGPRKCLLLSHKKDDTLRKLLYITFIFPTLRAVQKSVVEFFLYRLEFLLNHDECDIGIVVVHLHIFFQKAISVN